MTLKRKVAVNVAIAFSVLFGVATSIIYYSFSSFREVEFRKRLEEKALTTAKLLIEVKEIDKQLLRLIDSNTINKLYNEKTLIFDDSLKLIYSSLDDALIDWQDADLMALKAHKTFFREDKGKDVLGVFYDFENIHYHILIAAEDKYGKNQLRFLFFSLIITFLGGTLLVWLSTYFFIKKLLTPLDNFENQITTITVNKLNVRLAETDKNDEINLLTKAFNQMLLRIEEAFNSQRDFTSNASHEIRTPLTRIAFQLENVTKDKSLSENSKTYLKNIYNDVHHLSDLVNSLLLLSRLSKDELSKNFKPERIDEILFSAYQRLKEQEAQLELNFEIVEKQGFEHSLEMYGVKSLLEIAFTNLLKNAFLYSFHKKITVRLEPISPSELIIHIANEGQLLSESEQKRLFEPFFRGENAVNVYGSGLGLRIAKRIFDYHQATIRYIALPPHTNQFEISFSSIFED